MIYLFIKGEETMFDGDIMKVCYDLSESKYDD